MPSVKAKFYIEAISGNRMDLILCHHCKKSTSIYSKIFFKSVLALLMDVHIITITVFTSQSLNPSMKTLMESNRNSVQICHRLRKGEFARLFPERPCKVYRQCQGFSPQSNAIRIPLTTLSQLKQSPQQC